MNFFCTVIDYGHYVQVVELVFFVAKVYQNLNSCRI